MLYTVCFRIKLPAEAVFIFIKVVVQLQPQLAGDGDDRFLLFGRERPFAFARKVVDLLAETGDEADAECFEFPHGQCVDSTHETTCVAHRLCVEVVRTRAFSWKLLFRVDNV